MFKVKDLHRVHFEVRDSNAILSDTECSLLSRLDQFFGFIIRCIVDKFKCNYHREADTC